MSLFPDSLDTGRAIRWQKETCFSSRPSGWRSVSFVLADKGQKTPAAGPISCPLPPEATASPPRRTTKELMKVLITLVCHPRLLKRGRGQVKYAAVLQARGNFDGYKPNKPGKWGKKRSFASCCVPFCFFCVTNDNLIGFSLCFRWSCCVWVHHTALKRRRLLGFSAPVHTSPVSTGTETVSDPNSSRLGRGRAPGSNKSRTNIQDNVEPLISKNLKQNLCTAASSHEISNWSLLLRNDPADRGKTSPYHMTRRPDRRR